MSGSLDTRQLLVSQTEVLSAGEAASLVTVLDPQTFADEFPASQEIVAVNRGLLEDGQALLFPDEHSEGSGLIAVVSDEVLADPLQFCALTQRLPKGALVRVEGQSVTQKMAIAWCLAQYEFKLGPRLEAKPRLLEGVARCLQLDSEADLDLAQAYAAAVWAGRDLINWPADSLGPEQLAERFKALAQEFDADIKVVANSELEQNFPAIYAVGRAATTSRQPRLIDLNWGNQGPQITLVGKGVCYDTGGLNLKPGAFMRNMKKDMGGAAHVLALAQLIMELGLPVRLRVLVGAVENAVSANSFRPGDVITTRKGSTVEIGNTDAEGRLVLADCLTRAQEDGTPDLLLNFATLTGAARVALGTDIPAVFSNDQALADAYVRFGRQEDQPLWSLPLHRGYAKRLKSEVADLGNIAEGERYGDAIMAALFLDHFVDAKTPWIHVDCFAWNNSSTPGHPKGVEIQALAASLELVKSRLLTLAR